MKKKLQVFVSSTFTDLKEERQAAVSAILKLGHIPAGMELFTANDKSQWDTIKRWIDESDVYMLILGGRYGSIEKDSQLSYTELEYNYAVQTNKPLFAVVINENALKDKIKEIGPEIFEQENNSKLKEFRTKVLSNMSSFYEDVKDIKICIMESLPQINSERNLLGWVFGGDVSDVKNLVDEMGTLSAENSDLKKKLENALKNAIKPDSKEDKFNELRNIFKKINFLLPALKNGDDDELTDLLTIFMFMSSELVIGLYEKFCRTDRELFLFRQAYPKLELYGLVESGYNTDISTFNEKNFLFTLTELGKEFVIFNEKKMLLEE